MDANPVPGETFARWVARVQDGISDNALAALVGTSATMVGKYKRGVLPKVEAIRKFARWAKVRPRQLEEMVRRETPTRIMIRCPKTGKVVPVGWDLPPASFEVSTIQSTFNCPACGEEHAWTNQTAWLEGDEPKG